MCDEDSLVRGGFVLVGCMVGNELDVKDYGDNEIWFGVERFIELFWKSS